MPQILSNMSSYLVVGLLWTVYFGFHSLLASSQIKASIQQSFPSLSPYYRLLYNFIAAAGLLGIWLVMRSLPTDMIITSSLWPGYILMGMGSSLGFLSLRDYDLREFVGIRQVKEKEIETKTSLQISGFNQYVRHPLYLAIILFFWGSFLRRGDSISLATAITFTLYAYVGALWEEKKLIKAFGEDYQAYKKKTAMLIPFIF
mgnify:CR=1 FL=1